MLKRLRRADDLPVAHRCRGLRISAETDMRRARPWGGLSDTLSRCQARVIFLRAFRRRLRLGVEACL